MTSRRSPVMRHVRSLPGRYKTRAEVADELGLTINQLRYLRGRHGLRAPSLRTKLGRGFVYLYSKEDVEELRKFLAKPPMIEPDDSGTEAELQRERDRLYHQRRYHRQRADETTGERKAHHEQRLQKITDDLDRVNTALRARRKERTHG